jgi:membrane fusion protein (multidrug efflux system)
MKKSFCFTLMILFLAACGNSQPQQEESGVSHQTMVTSRSDIALEQSYPASVEGRQSIRIIPRVEGYLADIRIREGQRVSKGQVLFVLDQATYRADERAAQANVDVARAGVESAQLAYDSRKQLREKDIVSDFDLQSASTQLALAKAQLQQAQAQLESARSNLSYTVLTSPSDGVVGSLPYRVGDYVGPSIQDGLTTVADNAQMYVYFSLTERDVTARMQECGSMDKMIESFPVVRLQTAGGMDYPVDGRLESVSGVVDRSTGALSARAVFPNPDGILLSGSTGKLVVSNTLKNAIVIPQAATYEIQDKVYVYKVVDGKAQSAIITVMPVSDGQNYVVTGGLTEGETIVAKGASYIKEGMEI